MDKSNIILRKFNEKFVYLIKLFRECAPNIKEIILVEDAINFCINGGNPVIPLAIFKMSIYKYKDQIYKEDNKLLEENLIMTEFISTFKKIKDDKSIINKKELSNDKLLTKIRELKQVWNKLNNDKRNDVWKTLQILVKLSEKININ